ncbi:MAG: hypothetical protein KAS39_05325, partial [Actinomycetia bacterium]|nr:hypothetical protein [Actinomycetes bacterium]
HLKYTPIKDLKNDSKGTVAIIGVIDKQKTGIAKWNQRHFAILTIQDRTGRTELFVDPQVYEKYHFSFNPSTPFIFHCKNKKKGLKLERLVSIENYKARKTKKCHITIPKKKISDTLLSNLRDVLLQNHGDCPVLIHIHDDDEITAVKVDDSISIRPTDSTLTQIESIIGDKSIKLEMFGN